MAFLIPSASGRVLRAILLIGGTLSPLISSPLQGSVPVDFHSLPHKGQEMSVQKVLPGLRSLRIRLSNTDEEFEVTLLDLVEFPSGWKSGDLRWSDFPPSMMTGAKGVETHLRLRLENREEIDATDDPWLELFGEAVLSRRDRC